MKEHAYKWQGWRYLLFKIPRLLQPILFLLRLSHRAPSCATFILAWSSTTDCASFTFCVDRRNQCFGDLQALRAQDKKLQNSKAIKKRCILVGGVYQGQLILQHRHTHILFACSCLSCTAPTNNFLPFTFRVCKPPLTCSFPCVCCVSIMCALPHQLSEVPGMQLVIMTFESFRGKVVFICPTAMHSPVLMHICVQSCQGSWRHDM